MVLLPDEKGWRSKDVRVFADEISFFNQAIVLVPDLYRGNPFKGETTQVRTIIIIIDNK